MNYFKNKVIFISGGTGSFGKEFLEFLKDKNCKEIRVFSRDELKQEEMRLKLNRTNINFFIGDIRNKSGLDLALKDVDYVFHAAALKQVPSCEFFPNEALLTNVIGSQNVIDLSIKNKVKSVVCLSTDKAVYPINVMGLTKSMMEKLVISKAKSIYQHNTTVSLVRYGNVLMSRGSVIPLFVSQILYNKPITLTSDKMTRFLLPLDKAVDLVSFAITKAKIGDLFIRKSSSAKIIDIIYSLERIFNTKAKINNIGIRHGEKIHEVLATSQEMANAKVSKDYFIISADQRDLNYHRYFTKGKNYKTSQFVDYSSSNNLIKNTTKIDKLIKDELIKSGNYDL